ncbi:MAG TPA: hypothetical protein VN577_05160 [Terriglobales bacterium]|nr:hypothetical protein [Terriglobales bacterium]
MPFRTAWRLFAVIILSMGLCSFGWAQIDDTADPAKERDPFQNIKFRNLGPAVGGGRVASVVGVPGQPNVYYVGAAAGGVFKTIDGGLSWKAIFEKQPVASIGSIAVAPSNPNLIWVGTGEAKPRNDISTGRGVFFSPDAGVTWKHMGLADAGQIARVIVHPTNPDIVWVGVLGHAWGPNQERGVFKTTDGGKTWQKTLYVNDKTGIADMVIMPGNPMVLFAAMWEMQRRPWALENGGPNSAIWRSNDGGVTWKKLSEGLPKGALGRIGLAIAPSEPTHVYALIETKKGVLWDSKDLGDHWTQVNDKREIAARGFYFSRLEVAPDNPNRLYLLSFDVMLSEDGGKTAKRLGRGVHPDNHSLWIDPQNPHRMILGNDGGVYISSDAGVTWRYLDNLPIEQFYMVAHDDSTPYMLCGGLQDNNGWCGPSNSLARGGIVGADWWTTVGGDGEYIVPAGNKSNIIYASSQNAFVERLDATTGMSAGVRPYLAGVGQMAPSELKYRFNWTSPIAVSATDPKTVYLGGNVVFKSTDAGNTWTPISPDLTRNDKSKQISSGGSIFYDLSGAETFDTILSMSLSPIDEKVMWVGTDDGLVQVTRDGGKTWTNTTGNMKGLPEWGRVQQIEASPFDAGTCYVAFDLHQVDNNKPYVFRTSDFGKTWTAINKGLPENDPVRVVRENPNKKGWLVLGTETGLFYSANNGDTWTPLKSNFPTVPIYDLKFVKKTNDLIVASHGRGLFVMDDITPIVEYTSDVQGKDMHLFASMPASRWHTWNKRGFSQAGFTAPNPPLGAVISYSLKSEIEVTPEMKKGRKSPVKIVVTDETGAPVRTIYGPSKAGVNRAVWNLDYEPATRLSFLPEREPNEYFDSASGVPVLPGTYNIAVTVNGKTEKTTVKVGPDPRYEMNMEVARTQTKYGLETRDLLNAFNATLNRLDAMRAQLTTVQKLLSTAEEGSTLAVSYKPVIDNARDLEKKLKDFQEGFYNSENQGGSDRLHFLARLHDRVESLARGGANFGYNEPVSALYQDELAELRPQVQKIVGEFNALLSNDVTNFNKLALEKGANTLYAGVPIELKGGSTAEVGK